MKKTLVLGASTNPSRYSFLAAHKLVDHGHEIILVGLKEGEVAGQKIQKKWPQVPDLDTITLYVGPAHQPEYYDAILSSGAKRVIFNPGTENAELQELVRQNGMKAEVACTLVLLSIGNY